ncbi:MAG: glycosyltransferase family 2 protein [Bacteroidales bacterium]|nr:glycosyltransferase family 2 protein [Bacteroidales bacterium]
MLSVIVPIYNEEKYISKCIDSILEQDYPKNDLEVILVDGMSTDKTREIVAEYTAKYPFIRLIDNPKKIVPYAMNSGIQASKGDIIIRLDGHVEYPNNYFSALVKNLKALDADNVGALCETLPCGPSAKELAIAEALSSSFGMGNSYFRIGCDEVRQVDTVPFGCFKREVFDKVGLYDNELIRNQDDELNGRIIKSGGKIYLIPSIVTKYFARDKIGKVKKMFYQYGLYKPLVNKKLGAPATIRQFFPLVFVLGLIFGAMLSCISWIIAVMYLSVMVLYLLLACYFTFKSVKKTGKISLFLYQPLTYLTVHVSYGWGYLVGIYKILMHKPFNAESNR